MTPRNVKPKTRDRLLTVAREIAIADGQVIVIHDALLQAYADGWNNGRGAGREEEKLKIWNATNYGTIEEGI